ncbi:MAG: hypothetical protein ACI8VW_004063 [bacterium]|jgi:hypothetical protein
MHRVLNLLVCAIAGDEVSDLKTVHELVVRWRS